jgi:signal transduction histidine kinase
MKKNPFDQQNTPVIKRRENPKGKYSHLDTQELLKAVKQSAHSPHRGDLDILLELFLQRYNQRQEELDSLNRELERRIQEEVKQSKANQKRYEQQAKMAAMGEMMDAVAHQWKQPLNALTMMGDLLLDDFEDGLVDKAYIEELLKNSQNQIDHMVNTLTEFRNFFRPKQDKENFGIKRCLQSVMLLIKDEFIKNNINIHIQSEEEILLYGIENEFKHLALNILNNAKDAFNEREIKERNIYIDFYKKDGYIHIDIRDTAGGIPLHVIDHIFKPEVTTKEEGKGTGIGLYMSSQIAQKLGGKLSVKNIDNCACFCLKVPI